MKKILLATAAVAVLSSSAARAESASEFYLKANVGWAKLDKAKQDEMKLKSDNAMSFGVGAGYYIMDNVRAELAYDHFANSKFKGTGASTQDQAAITLTAAAPTAATLNTKYGLTGATNALVVGDQLGVVTAVKSYKTKMDVDTVLINGYVDLFDVSIAKFFVGAGVGYARVGGKTDVTTTYSANVLTAAAVAANATATASPLAIPAKTTTYKAKSTNNFAYAIHLGASTEFAPGITGELVYSYRNMGKTKDFTNSTAAITSLGKAEVKGHNVGVAVRFDI